MNILTGTSKNSWQPTVTADTTTSSYWLNWRVTLCSLWILISLVFASILISKYEYPRNHSREGSREALKESPGTLYQDEVWKPCLKTLHPAWLLGLRVIAFLVLLLTLILNVAVDGGEIMYYYTQWTCTLITIYFGLGSLLSIYGCYQYHNRVVNMNEDDGPDMEPGVHGENSRMSNYVKSFGSNEQHDKQLAGFWSYAFQVMFQLIVSMHSINAVFLLAETGLNCLRFPWFRIAYFFLWTAVYVIFQWIVHACMALWWPYPFLDLSSSHAPLWYLSVALLHIPCYSLFVLIMKLKHFYLSKWFPQSHQSPQ
ncbi:OLC1v1007240C1 [Oldenlandia corymbosa var. corymbosa]|uniref:OLC1v1007240C1 n=1 Tax=Oldenlandia corymbosa var. corymbosa TaxID=529605 RepID=A0AAV1DL85_OLDCO|nr:OLC1v1007240C1 [Oldenlandia corymbosa var. corymbosa]